jgi:Tfp pilus assembly protein PilV
MRLHRNPSGPEADPASAFTLVEVLIAGGILFMCLFAILSLVSNGLRNARVLQRVPVDPVGLLAAQASLSQKLVEASDSGDFGNLYPGYRWISETNEVETNGLFRVDFAVYNNTGNKSVQSKLSILLYRPDSTQRPGGGAAR